MATAGPVGLSMQRAALAGFGLGMAWGMAARVWMRLVSTTPEFSWAGTLAIVGVSGVFGAGVGVSAAARWAHGWRRWLRLAFLPGMVLFAGQGLPFLPSVVIAGPLLRRRSIVGKAVAVAAIVVPAVLIWRDVRLDETTFLSAPMRVQVAVLVGMPLLGAALAWGASLMWGPLPGWGQSVSPERARSSRLSDSSLEVPAGPA